MTREKHDNSVGRIWIKLKKYQYRYGIIAGFIFVFVFVIRILINSILSQLINNPTPRGVRLQKSVLFIEPPQQGYGDLFFQTPIFSVLARAGFFIDILVQRKHTAILENNKNIKNIFNWENEFLNAINKKHDIVIGLGKDSIKSNLVMLLKPLSKKIIPDKNLKFWHRIFRENSPSVAWQILTLKDMLNNPPRETPKIYFSKKELEIIKGGKRGPYSTLFIVGIDNKLKRYSRWNEVIKNVSNNFKIYLLNPDKDLVNKIKRENITPITTPSYREAVLEIAKTENIVGTEGSLMHIASALQKNIIVLEADSSFKKQTFLTEFGGIKILNNHTCKPWYDKNKKEETRLCFLREDGSVIKGNNRCLENIAQIDVIEAIESAIV